MKHNFYQSWVKRPFDVVVASLCLLFFSPLFLVIYIAIRLEDGCPAVYSQERVGLHGREFRIFKFRSMHVNAEENFPLLAQEQDDRLTKVGRFLRDHHLDELPQLWNVLIGDMSFIGPRPERQYFIEKIMERDARYELLYDIRPGVTSYATLYNGYTDTIEKMVRRLELDLYYLEHQSFMMDASILWKTFVSIVFGKKF